MWEAAATRSLAGLRARAEKHEGVDNSSGLCGGETHLEMRSMRSHLSSQVLLELEGTSNAATEHRQHRCDGHRGFVRSRTQGSLVRRQTCRFSTSKRLKTYVTNGLRRLVPSVIKRQKRVAWWSRHLLEVEPPGEVRQVYRIRRISSRFVLFEVNKLKHQTGPRRGGSRAGACASRASGLYTSTE